ncbi:MAG: hypothetical protein PHR68_02235 [Candidatus Gracilibacteria bacterium]|nr:hypothetical protein [Candidatus Gracilibacteria bacterium]
MISFIQQLTRIENLIDDLKIRDNIVKKVIDFKNGKFKKITKKEFKGEDNIVKTLNIYFDILGI